MSVSLGLGKGGDGLAFQVAGIVFFGVGGVVGVGSRGRGFGFFGGGLFGEVVFFCGGDVLVGGEWR